MTKTSIAESITAIIEPVVQEESLELVDVEYKKMGKTWTLRIYIDKDRGITVEDCQKVSHQIADMIEIDELIVNPFVLEVSSPGLDRPLKKEKDFLRYRGEPAEVKTFSPIENRRNFQGIIEDCKDQILYLKEDGASIKIPLDTIAKAKRTIEF